MRPIFVCHIGRLLAYAVIENFDFFIVRYIETETFHKARDHSDVPVNMNYGILRLAIRQVMLGCMR